MNTISFRTYPVPLSRICLGTAGFGNAGLTGEPLAQAFAILDAYYAMGGRFLDTANVYGRWGADRTNASEKVLGQWLKERRITDMTITTKACHWAPEAPDVSRVTAEAMAHDVEESRASLGLDKLDILLLHRDNEETDIRAIVDFCVPYVDRGIIERFGFSNFRAERVKTAIEYLGADWDRYFVGVSNEQSLAMDGAEGYAPGSGMIAADAALRDVQAVHEFPLFPYSSIAHGFFTKLQRCGAVYDGEWRNTGDFRGNRAWLTAKNGAAYNRLTALSAEKGMSLAMLSLGYLLAQPYTLPVMTVSRTEQLDELNAVAETAWDTAMFDA